MKRFLFAAFFGAQIASLVLVAGFMGCQSGRIGSSKHDLSLSVGQAGPNLYITPANQILTPVGIQVELPEMRPQAIALSPNGKLLVTSGKTHELVVINPESGLIQQRVALPSDEDHDPRPNSDSSHIPDPDEKGQLSYTGLVFSPDGSRIYLSNVNGSIKVFGVDREGKIEGLFTIPLPEFRARDRNSDIPSGLAFSSDGKRLYVALNLSNQLAELDANDGKVLRMWDVGVAPYDVIVLGDNAYVSNWGGRRPTANSLTGPAGRGTLVRVDPVRHIASEGSVSVIDLGENKVSKEIVVGLHSSAMTVTPNGRYLLVANAGSDTISVIDTRTDEIVETIWTRQSPADLFGASPNALVFDGSGRTLFVCNGTQNAVAVVKFDPGESKLQGLIPVGWFPGAIVHDSSRSSLYVANIKGIGSTQHYAPGETVKFNTHQYFGTLSLVEVPSKRLLSDYTRVALQNMRYPALREARRAARPNRAPRPVPERVGEPSVFKHVVYIIKENRTYDQVLGDIPEGNGDPSLCVFPEHVTPNQHKMVREFVLLDNTYCSGILSADGHQWSDTAFATDYMEKSFAGFPRSYPDGMEDADVDALAYSPAGFLWDNAIANGKTIRHNR